MTKGCRVSGCTGLHCARGWCHKHWLRWRRYGDPLTTALIKGDDKARFESKIDRSGGPDACHPWLGSCTEDGYGHLRLAGKVPLAHRVAWEFAYGPIPPGHQIDHECHNQAIRTGTCVPGICAHRLCCNERHLRSRVPQEHADATERWEHPRGSAHPASTLTEADVIAIRAALAAGETCVSLSVRYNVNVTAISKIKLRRTWRHV